MRTNFFSSSKKSSPSHSYPSSPLRGTYPPPTPRQTTFSSSIMEENVEIAEPIIVKWDVDSSTYSKIDSLFGGDRREAKEFLRSVKDLQKAMHFFVKEDYSHDMLVRSQKLMQIAMKRLEREFYQILSTNRNYLDPESVSNRSSRASRSSVSDFESDTSEDEFQFPGNSVSEDERISEIAMSDLKSIADCMISSGYGKECVKIYKLIRKSIIDESLYYLGVEKLSFSQIQKMNWEAMEAKIKSWLNAVKIAVKTLFNGERILCDHVFSASAKISETCFAEISMDGARSLFGFPELVAKSKKSPDKMFKTLDLYEAMADLWPEIESIFSTDLTSAVMTQAVTSQVKLGEAIRAMLSDFEAAIQKDTSKSPVPSGGVHPLTRYVMNYLVFLGDYSGILSDIVADWPSSAHSPLPETYFSSPTADDSPTSAISARLAWLVLVLLCKLDGRSELYKDVSLSYLFLMNNLNYVVSKARASNLSLLLGEDWLVKHEAKVKQYAANYERMGWSKVIASLPEDPTAKIDSSEAVKDIFRRFNSSFEEAYLKQSSWVVLDSKLRNEIKLSLARKIAPKYRELYDKYRVSFRQEMGQESIVRFAPEDLGNYLSDLLHGDGNGASGSTTSSSSSRSRETRHQQ